jgi:hypothetical protein
VSGVGRIDLFLILLVVCCSYALVRGGMPERVVAIVVATGVALTFLAVAPVALRYRHIELGVLAVDLASFLIVTAVAIRSERYWPLWMSALYFHQVLSHLEFLLPGALALTYGITMNLWGYPILLLLAAGTWRHQARLKRQTANRF